MCVIDIYAHFYALAKISFKFHFCMQATYIQKLYLEFAQNVVRMFEIILANLYLCHFTLRPIRGQSNVYDGKIIAGLQIEHQQVF